MVSRLVDVYDGEMSLEQATNDDYIARHLVKDVCPHTLLQGPSPLQQVFCQFTHTSKQLDKLLRLVLMKMGFSV